MKGANLQTDASSAAELPSSLRVHRFGEINHNEYLTRHNPHPQLVGFMEGLNGQKIRIVHEITSPRTMVYDWSAEPSRVPIQNSLAQLNKQNIDKLVDIDHEIRRKWTQQNASASASASASTDKRSFRPEQRPSNWREEVHKFTESVFTSLNEGVESHTQPSVEKPKTVTANANGGASAQENYSLKTGRLLEAPQRQTRCGTRGASGLQPPLGWKKAEAGQDLTAAEMKVMHTLSQLLQTDNLEAASHWLTHSSDNEKALTVNLVRSALHAQKDGHSFRHKQPVQQQQLDKDKETQDSSNKRLANILKVDHGAEAVANGHQPATSNKLPALSSTENGHGHGSKALVVCPHCHHHYKV